MTRVKICGVTTPEVAVACAALGVSALGLNFVPSSPRCITVSRASEIRRALNGAEVRLVGVVADLELDAMRSLMRDAELDCLQLHGNELPTTLEPLLPHAYKAVRVGNDDDVDRARAFGGEVLLVDAKVDGALGGSGRTFDWSLVKDLARERKVILAGGLRPENVGRAVREVKPWGVDVASGVESAIAMKDLALVRAFLAEANV
jgi:phosphoribosylanthranilate isomerase